MLLSRNGEAPRAHRDARIAISAQIIGHVELGAGCYVDHGVVMESAGPAIVIEDETIVFAGAVIRSVGGAAQRPFPVHIGARTLVSPMCTLTGCDIGRSCYLATRCIVLQGAAVGDQVVVGVGALVHSTTRLSDRARVGMRHIAVPTANGCRRGPPRYA
jgi:carbonic anhydrase/acetyltransferase-like protein (isoleucine patch superfamily)